MLREMPNGVSVWCGAQSLEETLFIYGEVFEDRTYARKGLRVQDGDTVWDIGETARHCTGSATMYVSYVCYVLEVYQYGTVLFVLLIVLWYNILHSSTVRVPTEWKRWRHTIKCGMYGDTYGMYGGSHMSMVCMETCCVLYVAGANVGLSSIFFELEADTPDAVQLYAFEPIPLNRAALQRNLSE